MPDPSAALPEDAVLLHIGPHKTGTTAIQGLLNTARDELAAHGVTYPGRWAAHHRGAWALLEDRHGWAEEPVPAPDPASWERLVHQTAAAPGRVVISSEYFARCDATQRARAHRELGADRLHVLIAARNPASLALSMWQQDLREGRAGGLAEWLEDNFRRPESVRTHGGFWGWTDAASLVTDWSEVLDADRIRVVVIDEGDRTLLPRTFEQLLGLPAGVLSGRTPPHDNRSLTLPEAELIQAAIAITRDELTWDEFSLFFRAGFARGLHEGRVPPPHEARPALPGWSTQQAVVEADATIDRLRASGVEIVGNLDDLRSVPSPGGHAPISDVPVELAAQAVAGMVRATYPRLRALSERADRLPTVERQLKAARAQVRRLEAQATDRPPTVEDATTGELLRALRDQFRLRQG